jgi:hypothetical protein
VRGAPSVRSPIERAFLRAFWNTSNDADRELSGTRRTTPTGNFLERPLNATRRRGCQSQKMCDINLRCDEVLFDELPVDFGANFNVCSPTDLLELPPLVPCVPAYKMVSRRKFKQRRSKREITQELCNAFTTGRFETRLDANGATYADFYLFVNADGTPEQESFRIYSDGSVMYGQNQYTDPWDLLPRFGSSRQAWQRIVYHGAHTVDWHLRKRIKTN